MPVVLKPLVIQLEVKNRERVTLKSLKIGSHSITYHDNTFSVFPTSWSNVCQRLWLKCPSNIIPTKTGYEKDLQWTRCGILERVVCSPKTVNQTLPV